ncbi:MAG: DUF3516 domain-containing protein [Microthrixaceae bacterium]
MKPLDIQPGMAGDDVLDRFTEWVTAQGLTMYPAQEDAALALFADDHVVITTPTGSGKSLVATAGHAEAFAAGGFSVYTAPIKALVSEKFFDFREIFGAENVGMVTGDSQINPTAPIVCCTAEILAHGVLESGRDLPLRHVTMDEFHYFSERGRGWAWELPLLELSDTRFLLMSATIGDTAWLHEHLDRETSRSTTLVAGGERPVPLSFRYAVTPLHETINELVAADLAPVYVVYFTQKAASQAAQSFMSLNVLTKEEKQRAADMMSGFRFDTPFGKDLRRHLAAGIGVHHAGLLPRYRLLVERMAREGLLKLICGTDTLGVGVNIPIRTVLLTQLCKFDGAGTRLLRVREFQQIAGRAGRRGYDTSGTVVVQAPAYWIENRRDEAKAANAGKRLKHRKKAPEHGFKDWNEDTFNRLVNGIPETLTSRFEIGGGAVLRVLERPGDGVDQLRNIVRSSFIKESVRDQMVDQIDEMLSSLIEAELIEALDVPDEDGRPHRPNPLLQERFSLDRPLSPFVVDMLGIIADDPDTADAPAGAEPVADRISSDVPSDAPSDASAPTPASPYGVALDMLSVIEASLEDPSPILIAQRRALRDLEWAKLSAQGVEFTERQEKVADIDWPKPLGEVLAAAWRIHVEANPWLAGEWVRPKSIVREMFEQGETFTGYVQRYGLQRSEGLILRYLTDCYRALQRNVPDHLRSSELSEIGDWLAGVIRSVDSSLMEEWERLERIRLGEEVEALNPDDWTTGQDVDITRNRREFRALVRTEMFRWVQAAARRALGATVADLDQVNGLDPLEGEAVPISRDAKAIDALLEDYWAEHNWIDIGPGARGPQWFVFEEPPATGQPVLGRYEVTQILVDPEESGEWRMHGIVDFDRSRAENALVVAFAGVERLI